jgi:ZIP family zinc transporter
MWTGLLVATALTAAIGYVVADSVPNHGLYAEGFAAGAVLTMLADSMMPEAFEHGGNEVGVITVVGYLIAAALTFAG